MDQNAELTSAIQAEAKRLGIDPVDLATVFSYETGGTFDPWKKGPTTQWGEHRGLIQWGEPQRQRYGVHEGMSVTAQVQAAGRYLEDRGVKPGTPLLDVYSAVNAGSVGRYDASDAANGGAPGTVADKVAGMESHRRNAMALFGGNIDFSAAPRGTPGYVPFAPAGSPEARVELNEAERQLALLDRQEDEAGAWTVMSDAFRMDNTLGRLLQTGIDTGFLPDEAYTPTVQELEYRTRGLPEKYHSEVLGVSVAHSDWLTRRAREDWQAEQHVEEAGLYGIGASVFASVADVPAILVGVATGGLGSAAAKFASFGRIGQRVVGALSGAAGNVAVEGSLSAMGRPTDTQQYVTAGLLGAAFGYAFGPLVSNPATQDAAAQGIEATQRLLNGIERGDVMSSTAISSGSVGAAANTGALTPLISQQDWLAVSDAYVDRAFAGGMRFDVAGRTGSSPNPAARLVSPYIMTDTAGRVDRAGEIAVNPIAADQTKTAISFTYRAALARTSKPAFEEWATENGYSLMGRKFGTEARTVFGELVASYMRTRSPMLREAFPEPVRRVGERMADLFDEMRQDQINPLRDRGGEGRPLAGFEDVAANRNYLTIAYDDAKITHVLETYGERAARELLTGSLISGTAGKIEAEVAERIAHGVLKNFRSRQLGLADRLTRALSGADDDFLRGFLSDLGLASDEVEQAVAGLARADKTGSSRTKARLGFDENFVLQNVSKRDGTGVADLRFTDLTVNDPFFLFDRYVDQMAGWIALGRVVIDDPTTGRRLVNGIRSEREIEQLLHHVRGRGADTSDVPQADLARRLEADEKNFRFAFDRILGKPHDAAGTDIARWMGVVRNWNFARLMGNLGVAQLMEVGSPVAYVGIKAMLQHMPAFRRIVEDGEAVLANRLDRELEAWIGIGTDPLRGTMSMIANEAMGMVDGVGNARLIDRAESFSRHAAHVTNTLSGGRDITAGMQKASAKLMAQKFADMAERAIGRDNLGTLGDVDLSRLSRSDMNRMRYLGLSDDILARALREVRANGEFADGLLFEGKLMQLNLDRWSDLEARSAFEMALFRASRKMIQETDIGAMHRWASAPLAQMVFQFRTFALTAWSNQFLHNVALRDKGSLVHFSATMMAAAAVYAAQTHIQAQFQADPDDFREKRLNPQALAAAAFQRSGWSSVLPMAVDTTLLATPFDPMFDFRTSQQASDALLGNPTFALFDDLRKGSQGAFRPLMDSRQMSQEEFKAITRLTALQNWMPLASIYSTMVLDMPRKPPRRREGYGVGERLLDIGAE